jgi:hypothetical protein
MKTLIAIALVILPSLVKAQRDTIVPMPISVARQIAKDLVVGDSCKEVLVLTKEELKLTQEKGEFRDSMYRSVDLRLTNATSQITNLQNQVSGYKSLCIDTKAQYDALAKKYRRVKGGKTAIELITMFVVGTLTYLIIQK